MKVHIVKLVDISAKNGGWPSHYSLSSRCGLHQPRESTTVRSRATCKGCLKAKV